MICTCTARAAAPLHVSGGYFSWTVHLLQHHTTTHTPVQSQPTAVSAPVWFRGPRTCVGVKLAARLRCVLRGSATGCFEVLLDVQACVADLSQRAGERGQERVQKAL